MTDSLLSFLHAPELPPPGKAGAVFRSAEHETGYAYIAPWEDMYAGFPEHCRRNAQALASTGAAVHLRSLGRRSELYFPPEETAMHKKLEPLLNASMKTYSAIVHQLVPSEAVVAKLPQHRYLPRDVLEEFNRRKVAYIVLERDQISSTMATSLNQLGQVWVSCELSREAVVNSGVEPDRVRVVHMPYRNPEPLTGLYGRPRPKGVPRFYHIGKWEPRKAQDKIFLAFMRAFKPMEAEFRMKTGTPFYSSTPGYPRTAIAAVREALLDPGVIANGWTTSNLNPSIRVVTDRMSEDAIKKLHAWGDTYVSLSHGEGWDMPAFDAMLAGNTVVYTPSGGPQEFLSPEWHFEVPMIGKIPCHPCYQWEPSSVRYWTYDVDVAADALRRAAQPRDPITFKPELDDYNARHSTFFRFSPRTVGETMLKYLSEL